MLADELAALDALGQAELVRQGEVTAIELVEAAIERIERTNPVVNAVVTETYESARAVSAGLLPDTPLAGVPFLLKDLGSSLGGVRQTAGSRALRDNIPTADGELVRRYKAAGLIVLGKTSTPEFGNHSTTEPVLFGPTRNPWALDRTAGGSSGGSAAAVAAGMVPVAHGGDGAGSIRIPASCCGLVGLKPSRGRNTKAPRVDSSASLSVEHVISRTVRDTAAFLDATAGPAPGDPFRIAPPTRPFLAEVGADPGRLRIGWSAVPPIDVPVHRDCVTAVRSVAGLLASLGHDVEEAAPDFDGSVLLEPMGRVWAIDNASTARSVARSLGREIAPDELEVTTWELIEYGRRFGAVDLIEAHDALGAATRDIAPFFERYDAWLTPTLAQPPLPLGVLNASYGGELAWWRFDLTFNPWNPVANVTGQPAISLPLGTSADGLPIGSMLMGRFGDEVTLLRLAAQLEAEQPWAQRRPPAFAT
ncbi:MAG TPA: amidase [Candidatus Acidoferrum sp.]|nr:amidase [Candidatus Acidoferrum sp.]